jgi:hypothetical protein
VLTKGRFGLVSRRQTLQYYMISYLDILCLAPAASGAPQFSGASERAKFQPSIAVGRKTFDGFGPYIRSLFHSHLAVSFRLIRNPARKDPGKPPLSESIPILAGNRVINILTHSLDAPCTGTLLLFSVFQSRVAEVCTSQFGQARPLPEYKKNGHLSRDTLPPGSS